jgi:hypothetical protein
MRDEAGFTIIEVMMAAAILLVGSLGTLLMIDTAQSSIRVTKAREQATSIQRELIEAARTIPYDRLTPGAAADAVRAQPGLGDSSISAAGWTIRRRDVTYKISMGACAVDDPKDDVGAHPAGVFCANPGSPTTPAQCEAMLNTGSTAGVTYPADCGLDANNDGNIDSLAGAASDCPAAPAPCDTAPVDYKRVITLVRWTAGGKKKWQLQATTINSPGIAAAPAVTDLKTTNVGGGTAVTTGSAVNFQATATTQPQPKQVWWYVDGNRQGDAAAAGAGSWTFTWNLGNGSDGTGVLDGDYLVSAKAFDEYGQYGQARAITISVDRRQPFAPIGVRAGRNGAAVDLEWVPNKERDIRGYNVYQEGVSAPVCTLMTDTQCRVDPSAVPPAGSGTLKYYVRAVDLGGREGDESARATVNDSNTPPNPPTTLNASSGDNGSVILSWVAPAVGDPDAGDSIDHYVIYRDGSAYADRYDRTSTGSDVTWSDTKTNGLRHQYWVTAMDTQLGESAFVGPVALP